MTSGIHGVSDLLHYPDGKAARNSIIKADNLAFGRAKGVYTISQNVSRRLQRYNNVASEAVYPPSSAGRAARVPRLWRLHLLPEPDQPAQRQDLVVEALAHTKSNIRLVFTGVPDNDAYLNTIVKRSKELGVADRIEWRGSASEDELVSLYAESLAVVYTPRDEDYGYVTLEAMLSHKAVLTCDDLGGPLEFVLDGEDGGYLRPRTSFDRAGAGPAVGGPPRDGADGRGVPGSVRPDGRVLAAGDQPPHRRGAEPGLQAGRPRKAGGASPGRAHPRRHQG